MPAGGSRLLRFPDFLAFLDFLTFLGQVQEQEVATLLHDNQVAAMTEQEVAAFTEQEAPIMPEIVEDKIESPMEISYRNIDEVLRSMSTSMVRLTTNVDSFPLVDEAEISEEALLKRISEKDKQLAKMK
jgi:hypothetical protein